MTLVPLEALVRPVEGSEDLFAFRFDFLPEAKAVDSPVVTESENGDLIIEGYAAVFDGIDREGENFHDGAFEKGIKSFIEGQASLCYHHKHDKLLGKVLDLVPEQGKGLRMRARVDGAIRKHPELGTYYEQIKNGSLNALSVGGFFKRAIVDGAQKIVGVDFTEISATPVPVHSGTRFSVVAGKALTSEIKVPEVPVADVEIRDDDVRSINYLIEELNSMFDRISKSVAARTAGDA